MNESCHTGICRGAVCGDCCTKVIDLSVSYRSQRVIDHVNLHFHCGDLTAIVGPNGGGKTTLLRAILGDLRYRGEVRFVSQSKGETRPRIGYVPQQVNVDRDTPMSVRDLLVASSSSMPVWMATSRASTNNAIIALERAQAAHLLHRRIGELSGGELQRVLLACAMNPLPEILLLDEPVSGVDARGLALFYETICDLRRDFDISIILVTHDLAGIAPHANRMVLVNKTILADGTPAEVLRMKETIDLMGTHLMDISKIPDDSAAHVKR